MMADKVVFLPLQGVDERGRSHWFHVKSLFDRDVHLKVKERWNKSSFACQDNWAPARRIFLPLFIKPCFFLLF
jgi:hypothetical protein